MIDDDFQVDLKELANEEIRELLLEAGSEISVEQAAQLARFVAEAGSLEEAIDTLRQLAQQREAA